MSISKSTFIVIGIFLALFTILEDPIAAHAGSGFSVYDTNFDDGKQWSCDRDQDKIDDTIEEIQDPEERIGVFICYDHRPDENDAKKLAKFDLEAKYIYKYIDVICARGVAIKDVKKISNLPGVDIVKLEPEVYPALDVSSRAIKARESEEYSPLTVGDLGFTGEGISIAILDTGVDDGGMFPGQHHDSLDDLDDNPSTNDPKRIAGVDFTQEESILNPRDGTADPDDTNGHGTHCAGIAMGTGGSDGTYMGMAPQARLVDVRIGEVWGSVNAGDAIAGIEWCISHKDEFNIHVLSLSFGSMFGESDGTDEQSQVVNQATDAGLVVAASMGNDGEQRVHAPAAADGAIAVGSVNDMSTIDRSDDTLSDFSNTGPRQDDGDEDQLDELKPDVVAYGEDITSARANTASDTREASGTSMSCPHVAGIIALMLDANPDLTPEKVKTILRETAEMPAGVEPSYPDLDPKYNTKYGWGIVDAYEAVRVATQAGILSCDITSPSKDEIVKGTIEITGTASNTKGSIEKVEVAIDDQYFNSNLLEVNVFEAQGTTKWNASWNTNGYSMGTHTIYAKAKTDIFSSNIATVKVVVTKESNPVNNGNPSNGDGTSDSPSLIESLRINNETIGYYLMGIGVLIAVIIVVIIVRNRMLYR